MCDRRDVGSVGSVRGVLMDVRSASGIIPASEAKFQSVCTPRRQSAVVEMRYVQDEFSMHDFRTSFVGFPSLES